MPRILSFLLCCLLPSFPAAAQDLEEEELEEEFELLEESAEVVVSAARHEQKIGFSPNAVLVITRKEIEASGAVNFVDLLRRWPVTHVYEFDPLYPSVEVRTNYRVLLLIDGREVNLELFVAPFYATLPIGLDDIERVEIVLGASSAIYGANAVSAVINVITRRPRVEPGAEAFMAAGEHGGLELDLRAWGGAGPLALRLSGGLSRSDSWMQQAQSAKNVWRADGRAELDLGQARLDLDAGFSRIEGTMFSILGTLYVPYTWMLHADSSFRYENLRLHAFWFGSHGPLDADISISHPSLGVELGRMKVIDLTGDTAFGEAQLDLKPWNGNLLILGADTRYVRYHAEQFVIDTIEEWRAGAYFHDEQKLGEKWLLQAGLRYDFNSRTDWALSPRGAVIFNPAGEHYFRLSGGLAFRKPSLMETSMNFEVEADPAFPEIKELFEKYGLSDPDIGNELLSSVEIGWRSSWLEGRLKTSVDAYAAFNRHVIGFRTDVVFDDTPLGPRLNLEESRIGYEDTESDGDVYGAHLSLEGRPLDWLSLFVRVDLRASFFTEQGYVMDRWYPNYILAAGASFEEVLGLHGQVVLTAMGETTASLRNPETILGPSVDKHLPARVYMALYLGHAVEAGPMKLDVGVSCFNVFNGRFREEQGAIKKDGTNFGGEILERRLMALVRIAY